MVKSGDPVEQEKQLKYATFVANTVMLRNVADLTDVLTSMIDQGHLATSELVGHISHTSVIISADLGALSSIWIKSPSP